MKTHKKNKKKAGFSLIEIMVVVVIIALLGTIVGVNVVGSMADAKITTARSQIRALVDGVERYNMTTSKYPSKTQGLDALKEKVGPSKKPIMKKVPRDPWKNKYMYFPPEGGDEFYVISYGADGKKGGEGENADIDSRNLDGDDEE